MHDALSYSEIRLHDSLSIQVFRFATFRAFQCTRTKSEIIRVSLICAKRDNNGCASTPPEVANIRRDAPGTALKARLHKSSAISSLKLNIGSRLSYKVKRDEIFVLR